MADGGNPTVFETIAVRELNVGSGSSASIPAINLLSNGGASDTSYIRMVGGRGYIGYNNNIMVLQAGSGKAITFNASSTFGSGEQARFSASAPGCLELAETTDNTPTLTLSGGLFVSGGALWYKGFGGSYTRLAIA